MTRLKEHVLNVVEKEKSVSEELYKRHRPTKFSQLVGQREASQALKSMFQGNKVPHSILLTGPSGTGKTTIARILKEKLGCSDIDYQEINASNFNSVDDIRQIEKQSHSAPIGGKCRIWYMDEVHRLSANAQDAFLKPLEDTPSHIYYLLSSTDPNSLKKAILTRCTTIQCKALVKDDLIKLVNSVAKQEDKELHEQVANKIAVVADGSARQALVLLHSVIDIEDKEHQIAAIEAGDVKQEAVEIARLLMKNGDWNKLKNVLKNVDDDPEKVRRMILSYCNTILLKEDNPRAAAIIEEFWESLFYVGKPGLTVRCYNLINMKKEPSDG